MTGPPRALLRTCPCELLHDLTSPARTPHRSRPRPHNVTRVSCVPRGQRDVDRNRTFLEVNVIKWLREIIGRSLQTHCERTAVILIIWLDDSVFDMAGPPAISIYTHPPDENQNHQKPKAKAKAPPKKKDQRRNTRTVTPYLGLFSSSLISFEEGPDPPSWMDILIFFFF